MRGTGAHAGHGEGQGPSGNPGVTEVTGSHGCRHPAWLRPPPRGRRAGPAPCGPSPVSAGSPGDMGTPSHPLSHPVRPRPSLAQQALVALGTLEMAPSLYGGPIPVWTSPVSAPTLVTLFLPRNGVPCPHSTVPVLHPMSPSPHHRSSIPVPMFPSLRLPLSVPTSLFL